MRPRRYKMKGNFLSYLCVVSALVLVLSACEWMGTPYVSRMVYPTNVMLNHKTAEVDVNRSIELFGSYLTNDSTGGTCSWSSSNTKIATVSPSNHSDTAYVTGVAPGSVTITAKAENGFSQDTCVVNVHLCILGHPTGVTTDGTQLYVADKNDNLIRRIALSTGIAITLAGSGNYGSANGTGTAASFEYLMSMTMDGNNLYATDGGAIRKIAIDTGEVTTLASSPNGIGIAKVGTNLYATNFKNQILKIVIGTGEVTTFAGTGSSGSADGPGAMATFTSPTGLTTDGTNLYVTDSSNNLIRKIAISTGIVTTFAGSGHIGSADGAGAAASFNAPGPITTDGTSLYVVDRTSDLIRKIVIATGEVTTLAGSGSSGKSDGIGAAASFNQPEGLATDGTYLYVADTSNKLIRKVVIATGEVTTIAGSK
jgi:sugar lactone lactonase YvrE